MLPGWVHPLVVSIIFAGCKKMVVRGRLHEGISGQMEEKHYAMFRR
jgi:hypothetical protein